MKKFLGFLLHPITISVFGLILISLLIWFGGPVIKFGEDNSAPLASPVVRLVCIMVVIVLWGLNNLRLQMKTNKSNKNLVDDLEQNQADLQKNAESGQAAEEVHQLSQRFAQALDTLKDVKFSGGGRKKALYELPWYIIVGPPGSGKTTALVNSGLEFPLAEKFGKGALQGVGGTRNCDWWFTNSAVLIDTAGRYTTQDSHRVVDSSAWEGFLKLLKRNRPRRPINGAIVAISLQDLLTQTEEERMQNANTIRQRLDELMEKLEIRFPVYLMFTKVDMVSGFREFFEDLNKEDRDQVWGVSLPNAPKPMQEPDFNFFSEEFGKLIRRLYDRVLSRVHQERNVQRRTNIYDFPQQMENLESIAAEFVRKTFAKNRYKLQPYLRGVYFTSGTQDGTPIDRLMTSISANFGFSRESGQSASQQGRSYFLTRLFQEVIFPESELVGSNTRYEKIMRWSQRGAILGMAVVAIALILTWSGSITRHKSYMAEVTGYTDEFTQEAERISPWNKDIRVVLPSLNAMEMASKVYDQEEHPWLAGVGLYDSRVDEQANRAYDIQLEKLFLPRIIKMLEDELAKGHDGGDLYNNFRMYMMFKKREKFDAELLAEWFKERWDVQYRGEATRRKELERHLENLLALDLEPLELNPLVVSKTRQLLLQVPVAKRVYNRLKTNPVLMQEVNLLTLMGEPARTAFRLDAETQKALRVPVLFTIDGYENTDLSPDSELLKDVVNERWVLDDDDSKQVDFAVDDLDELSRKVKQHYYSDYVYVWRKLFAAIDVNKFSSLDQANEVLLGFTDPTYSPLRTVLEMGVANTRLTLPVAAAELAEDKGKGKLKKLGKFANLAASKRKLTPVDKRFKDLHALMQESPTGMVPFETWVGRIQQLQAFVSEVSLAPDPGQKAYQIAKARYESGAANPVAQLRNYAQSAPDPLKRWLIALSDEAWRLIMANAKSYVDLQWKDQIYSHYNTMLNGRYPLKRNSSDELALFDFVEFFKPSGMLDVFFQEYVAPFVNTKTDWNSRAVDGYSMGFSGQSIKQLRQGLAIRDTFFRDNPESPTIRVELRPFSMSRDDARFTLDVAETRLTYNHGPKFWKPVAWSGADEGKRIRVAIEDISGVLHQATYSGPWAWFRLMDASKIERTSTSNIYRITFSASRSGTGKPHKVVYQGKTKSINHPLSSSLLATYKTPESL